MKIKGVIICITSGLISACNMAPKPLTVAERYQRAQEVVQQMFAEQPPICGKLDFNQAMARGLQFNIDYRIKQANSALKTGQMHVAEFAMFPEATLTGSVYNRNNLSSSYGSNPDGSPSTQVLNGSDKTIRSARAGVKWNILNLWSGYLNARVEGEKVLIAEEESRQQLQKLVQDVRVAYWRAYSAQQMSNEVAKFQNSLQHAKKLVEEASQDKNVPLEKILNYQASLLDANRRLIQLEDRLNKAKYEFRFIINLPVNQPLVLEKPSVQMTKIQDLKNLDFEKLDAITLVNRPELRGQDYQRRIAKLGVNAAVVQALPEVALSKGRNFNSNSFLVNNFWTDREADGNWNIFKLASLPYNLKTAKTQTKYETLKLMAITLTALNQTRTAYGHYQNLAKECKVAKSQTVNAERLYNLLTKEKSAALSSYQQVVMAKLQLLIAKMEEDLVLADLSEALGELYLASGFDVLPLEATGATPPEVLKIIKQNFFIQDNMGFKNYVNITYQTLFNESKNLSKK